MSEIVIDDQFVPTPKEGVNVVDVISKKSARRFVLIHPQHNGMESLDVKSHFVWDLLDGETSIAQIKQAYYGKFKVLPTQELLDWVRSWFQRGFLEQGDCDNPKAEREILPGWWGMPLPSIVLRGFLGPVFTLFVHAWFFWLCLAVGFGGLLFFFATQGPLYLHRVFESLETPTLMACVLLGAYLPHLLMVCLRLGLLFRGKTFRGDRTILGFWWIFPSMGVGHRGLKLKSHESVFALRGIEWVLPLACSMVFSSLAYFVIPSDQVDMALGVSLGSLIFFLLGSCPFLRGSLWRAIESMGAGVHLDELRAAYRSDADLFKEEYGERAFLQVQISMASVLIWVVLGSSYLLFTFARVAEVMGSWGKEVMALGHRSSLFWQILLYAPLLLGFFWMLWKLVEPFIARMIQFPMWKEERFLAPILCSLSALMLPLYHVMPDLLMRVGCVLLLLSLMVKTWYIGKGKESTIWRFLCVGLLGGVTAMLIVPQHTVVLNWFVGGLWLFWSIWSYYQFSPPSLLWFMRTGVTALLTFFAMVILTSYSLSPALLWQVSFSIWLGWSVWMCSGQMGVQGLSGVMTSGLFWLALSMPADYSEWAEPVFASSLIMSFLAPLGWQRARLKCLGAFSQCLFVDMENPEKSVKDTMHQIMSLMLGKWATDDLAKGNVSLPKFSAAGRRWMLKFLDEMSWREFGRIALNGAKSSERKSLEEEANLKVLSRMELKGKLSLEQKVRVLNSQLSFKGFSKPDIEPLADYLEVREYEADDLIMEQGADGRPCLEIILKGHVVLERTKPGGSQSVLAELGAMEALKFDDLFSDAPYDFTARCEGSVVTVRLYRQHVVEWALQSEGRMAKVLESVNLANMIMGLSLFRDFSSSQIRLVMEKLQKVQRKAGEDVITQGDEGDEFYLLDKGEVAILIHGNEVARLKEGSYFGEIALLEKCKRTATVRTTKPCVLYSLVQKDFDRFFSSGRGAQVLQNVSSSRGNEVEA